MDELIARLRELVELAETENRPLTDEEATEAEGLRDQIDAYKKTAEFRSLSNAYSTPRIDVAAHVAGSTKDEVSEEFRAFQHWMVTGQENAEMRALTIGSNSAGGYLVPSTTQAKIVERLKAFGGLAQEATSITTATGEPILWATNDDTGNTAEVVAEGAAAASAGADKVLGQKSLGVVKYEATGAGNLPMKVSWEFLNDSPINVENWIADNFAQRIARKFSVDICVGSGNGLTAPQGIVTPQTAFDEIASNAAGPTYAELVGAVAALDPAYTANAKFLMNPATWWFLVANLLDTSDRPLLQAQAQAGAGSAISRQLLGFEVVLDPGMPVIGDQSKSIVFGDLRQSYIVRNVGGFHLQRFNELYGVNGFVGFLGWERKGGMVQSLDSYVVLGGQNV